jgi:tRNA U38,U39,U40 pseudouridine synthase TruA
VEEFAGILSAGSRAAAGDTAPACGLYLVRVSYPDIESVSISEASFAASGFSPPREEIR